MIKSKCYIPCLTICENHSHAFTIYTNAPITELKFTCEDIRYKVACYHSDTVCTEGKICNYKEIDNKTAFSTFHKSPERVTVKAKNFQNNTNRRKSTGSENLLQIINDRVSNRSLERPDRPSQFEIAKKMLEKSYKEKSTAKPKTSQPKRTSFAENLVNERTASRNQKTERRQSMVQDITSAGNQLYRKFSQAFENLPSLMENFQANEQEDKTQQSQVQADSDENNDNDGSVNSLLSLLSVTSIADNLPSFSDQIKNQIGKLRSPSKKSSENERLQNHSSMRRPSRVTSITKILEDQEKKSPFKPGDRMSLTNRMRPGYGKVLRDEFVGEEEEEDDQQSNEDEIELDQMRRRYSVNYH